MGQVRHGSATTTHAVRAAIQRSQASLATLSRDLGINPKTVAKWRKRQTVDDLKTGPKEPRSTVLTEAEEAAIVAFRRHTLLPLDDCLYALQPSIPHLTRSALHRCLQRHGISRLPDVEGDKPKRSKFKRYPIGFFHIDIAELQTAEGKLFLFVGIDRTSKFAVTQLVEKADRKTAWEFLQHMLEAVPYQVHTILTDNGIQFAEQPRNRNTAYSRPMRFDMICEANGIEHRLTKPNHPWTNGQVERMNRTIKEATVKRFHYDSHDQLRTHLSDFMAAYNFARRLKTLGGLTPYEYICKIWTSEPDRFILNPIHQMPGLNTYFRGDYRPIFAAMLTAELPELGRMTAGEAAVATGMLPVPHDSGAMQGRRTIAGGRRSLRHVLFQAALAAACHNPVLKPVAKGLKERGKSHKLVIIAIARRIVTIAYAIIKTDTPWQVQHRE
jgi:transposase InsO family protein